MNKALNNQKPVWRRPIMFGIVLLLLAISVATQYYMGASGDKKFLLVTSRMWLGGKQLYTDLFQPSFPLITWLYALPIYLNNAYGLTLAHGLALLAFFITAASVLACRHIMKHHPFFAGTALLSWHDVTVLFILVFFANPLFFGDREHLITVLMFPYFLRFMPTLANYPFSRGFRILIAIMAALGVCIKPHAIILIVGVALLRLKRERKLAAVLTLENWLIGLVLAVYLLGMWCYTPSYFTVMLPMLMATYSANTKGILAIQYYVTSGFMLAAALADFRLRFTSPIRKDILYFLGLCLFCLGYVMLNNGWIYTFYPLNSIIVLTAVWVWWEFRWLKRDYASRGENAKQFTLGATACFLVLLVNTLIMLLGCVSLLINSFGEQVSPRTPVYNELKQIISDSGTKSFGTITITANFWPDAVEKTGAFMDTRFCTLFMLPKFLMETQAFAEKYKWILEYTANGYAQDLDKHKPALVIVDASNDFAKMGKPLDLVAYFSAYPAFAESWKHYHLFKTVDHCDDPALKDMGDREQWCRHKVYKRDAD